MERVAGGCGCRIGPPLSIELDLDPMTRDYRTCDAENPISTVREGRRGARIGGGGEAW